VAKDKDPPGPVNPTEPTPKKFVFPTSLIVPKALVSKAVDEAQPLFSGLWRNPQHCHFLGKRDPLTSQFSNVSVLDGLKVVQLAKRLCGEWSDVYVACAEFLTNEGRTQANAVGAYGFWADIDCGEQKATQGKGYATIELALAAVESFCTATGLPKPNFTINSGGGIHVHWVMTDFVLKDQWQAYARKLKAVADRVGFLADPSRTADIASVMRIPGTLNRKYDPPKSVTLLHASSHLIDTGQMLAAIQKAYDKHVAIAPAEVRTPPTQPATKVPMVADDSAEFYGPPNLAQLASALKALDPDCDEFTWKFHRLAPLANAARQYPERADELKALAKAWSSGELRGLPAMAWSTPGATSRQTGEQVFDGVWHRFMTTSYEGKRVTVGTIYLHALGTGWRGGGFEPEVNPRSVQAGAVPVAKADTVQDDVVERQALQPLDAALRAMAVVVQRTKEDVGAPFEPEALQAMAVIRKTSPPDFQRVKQQLKSSNKNIQLVALESALKGRQTSGSMPTTHHGYAVNMLARLTIDGHAPVAHDGTLYVLNADTNIWTGLPMTELEKQVAQVHDGQPNCIRQSDYKAISVHVMTLAHNDTFFAAAAVGIATPDGFYRIIDDRPQLEPLAPDHRQRVRLPFSPKQGPMPLFEKFLRETFKSDGDGEEQEQCIRIQEMTGAIMLGLAPRYQKAFKYYDPFGRAGKGTLVDIARRLVPPEFIKAVSPFNWDREYYVVSLAGARLNLVGELPDGQSLPSAQFKSVLGGDLITGRNPTHRPISFRNEAAHVFMTNHMINTRDQGEAFFARWEIVEFPNSLLRTGLQVDPKLAERIVEHELPAIASWAMDGAARLLKQGRYSPSKAHDRLMAKWRRTNSSLEEFIDDNCSLDSHFYEKRVDFYREYKAWCADNGRQPYAKARVKELLTHNIGLGITHSERDGYEIFKGVQVKEICKSGKGTDGR
jgi:P4 family phage/plasmid primase-like protien